MNRTKILAIVTAVSISACLYACGSDDDTNPVGGGGAGGHAGSKSGGSGGKSGGSGGKGAENGGTGNEAGETSGGEGGALGLGGAGGDMGMAGDTSVGGDKGAGGEGGSAPVALTLAEACAATCTPAHTLPVCGTTQELCASNCTDYTQLVADLSADAAVKKSLNDDYLALLSCTAAKLPTVDKYTCGTGPVQNAWSLALATDCETALCKWTCNDADHGTSSVDEVAWTRCCN